MARKQFVWIMTDTTGYNMVSCYGSQVKTPYIDSIAENGMRFECAYTCQPVCGPARSALFTGQFPHSNGSWGNSMPLGADVKTLGQRISAAGIRCAYIGKWHLDAGDYFGNGICPDGWDENEWYDMKCYLDELTEEERFFSRQYDSSDKNISADFTFGHRITERALSYIKRHKDEDFFLVVSYDEPHGPCLAPEPFASMYGKEPIDMNTPAWQDDLSGKPELLRLWAEEAGGLEPEKRQRGIMYRLAACNTFIDSEIGRVLECARTETPDSLRMFTSDHGDAGHAHGLASKGPAVYDEIARIPLLFEGHGVQPKSVYSHTVSQIDLPATVIDYMGLPRPAVLEGHSLLPQLCSPATPTGRPAFTEFTRYEIDHDGFGGFQPMRAVITDDYKLALHLLDTDELYDIKADPYDCDNLINNECYAGIRDELHDMILDWMNETRDPFRGYQWKCRPWRPAMKPSWDVDGYTRQRKSDPGEYVQLDYCTGLPIKDASRPKGK